MVSPDLLLIDIRMEQSETISGIIKAAPPFL
jgi:hypothetical protein